MMSNFCLPEPVGEGGRAGSSGSSRRIASGKIFRFAVSFFCSFVFRTLIMPSAASTATMRATFG